MLRLQRIPALLDFLLKLLFAEHISSVSLCHLSSLPQLSGWDEMFSRTIAGGFACNIAGTLGKSTAVANGAIVLIDAAAPKNRVITGCRGRASSGPSPWLPRQYGPVISD